MEYDPAWQSQQMAGSKLNSERGNNRIGRGCKKRQMGRYDKARKQEADMRDWTRG
jgi:hypothetical protein